MENKARPRLKALQGHTYSGAWRDKDTEYDAMSRSDARILTAIGKSVYATASTLPKPPAPAPTIDEPPAPARGRNRGGAYKSRVMTVESSGLQPETLPAAATHAPFPSSSPEPVQEPAHTNSDSSSQSSSD